MEIEKGPKVVQLIPAEPGAWHLVELYVEDWDTDQDVAAEDEFIAAVRWRAMPLVAWGLRDDGAMKPMVPYEGDPDESYMLSTADYSENSIVRTVSHAQVHDQAEMSTEFTALTPTLATHAWMRDCVVRLREWCEAEQRRIRAAVEKRRAEEAGQAVSPTP